MLNIRDRRHLNQLRLHIKDTNDAQDTDKYDYLKSDSGTLVIDNKWFVFFDWYEDFDIYED